MTGRKFGSGRATRPDHAANEWRKEAVKNRFRIESLERRIATAAVLIAMARTALDADDQADAQNALTDALRFLITDERTAS